MNGEGTSLDAYAQAGVDVIGADRLVAKVAELAASTRRREVLADVGPFSGLFQLGGAGGGVLVASADGVGTKLRLSSLAGRHRSLGNDLVNHCVNDILTAGADPLFFLDYIGGAGLADDVKLELVGGMADACKEVGCALLGGETADMPGIYRDGDFDIVGFIVGVVSGDSVIDGSRVSRGDVLLALPSNGLHTNGYSLVRKVFGVGQDGDPDEDCCRLQRFHPELGTTLGDALLAPHVCYYRDLKPVLPRLNGIAHITGGGLPGNISRILPDGLAARLDRSAWDVPPIFHLIQEIGSVEEGAMFRTFNMGLGIVVALDSANVGEIRSQVPEAMPVGEVVEWDGGERVLMA